jgi:hypothetical protein
MNSEARSQTQAYPLETVSRGTLSAILEWLRSLIEALETPLEM